MVDLMGSDGLAWHQWLKHGRCLGLSAEQYYDVSRKAYSRINRSDIFRKILKQKDFPAQMVEFSFLQSNMALKVDMVTLTCKRGHLQEVHICLTKELEPRECGADTKRDCTQRVTSLSVR